MTTTETAKTEIRPFVTKPAVKITAPCAAATLCQKLGIENNIKSGAMSYRKQSILSQAVRIVAGERKPRESAEHFAARAQETLNAATL